MNQQFISADELELILDGLTANLPVVSGGLTANNFVMSNGSELIDSGISVNDIVTTSELSALSTEIATLSDKIAAYEIGIQDYQPILPEGLATGLLGYTGEAGILTSHQIIQTVRDPYYASTNDLPSEHAVATKVQQITELVNNTLNSIQSSYGDTVTYLQNQAASGAGFTGATNINNVITVTEPPFVPEDGVLYIII